MLAGVAQVRVALGDHLGDQDGVGRSARALSTSSGTVTWAPMLVTTSSR